MQSRYKKVQDSSQVLKVALVGRDIALTLPAISICPEIKEIIEELKNLKPLVARMSGSGSTCFAIFKNEEKLKKSYDYFYKKKTMKILFEKEAPKSNKSGAENKPQIWGKSPWLQSVVVDLPLGTDIKNYIGKIIDVKIIKSRPSSLFAELC